MSRFIQFLKHEIPEVAAVTAYFLCAFGLIGLLEKLFLLEHGVQFAGVAKAAIGALIVGKVVVILDKTSAGERFAHVAVYKTVLYRSFVYTLLVALVLVAEKVFHGYLEAGTLSGGVAHAAQSAVLSRTAADTILVFVSFLGYALMAEIESTVGRQRLMHFLLDDDGRLRR